MPASKSNRSARAEISVGIGSWTDKEYNGLLYPKGTADNQRLATYATWFDHVELNMGYHRIPPVKFTQSWVQQTPPDFIFDFKLHKDFSTDPDAVARGDKLVPWILRSAQPLIDAGKLGAFFLVLSPSFGPEKHKLEELDLLVEKLQPHLLAVELRHNGWVTEEQRERTLEFYRNRKLVWIAVDMPRIEGSTIMPPVDEVTNSRMAYLRLHGRRSDWLEKGKSTEEKHAYEYSDAELAEILTRVGTLAAKAGRVHVVANNHARDFAPKTALALKKLLAASG